MSGYEPCSTRALVEDILSTHYERWWSFDELAWEAERIRGEVTPNAVKTGVRVLGDRLEKRLVPNRIGSPKTLVRWRNAG